MKIAINKSRIRGKAQVPSSKSLMIRALMCAALARGESEILHPLICDDANAAEDVLTRCGVQIQKEADVWRVHGGDLVAPDQDLNCGESATTLRFMTAICSLIPGKHRLIGGPSLSTRPVKSLVEALKMVGIRGSIEGKTTPPVIIEGGNLKGGVTELPGNISSQFVSALLLIAPFARKEMSIRLTTPLTSKPYVLMTLWCQKQFGVNVGRDFDKFVIKGQKYAPTQLEIEGDWSSASYLLALGAVSDGVEVENLKTSSLQGDRVILDFIRSMGARVKVESGSITVNEGELKAIQTDLSDCIDLLPTMGILAALATGKSVFSGIERARIKESNRVAAVKEGLVRMGIEVVEDRDSLTITGMKEPTKDDEEEDEEKQEEEKSKLPENEAETVVIDSHNDHRIAMAFGVMGAAVGNVVIDGAECVSKTYPHFWDTLKGLGVDWTQSE